MRPYHLRLLSVREDTNHWNAFNHKREKSMRAYLFASFIALFTLAAQAGDIDVVDQRYINQLTKGGNVSIKQAAQSIYNTGEKDTEVLDVAAEVLLQRYPTAAKADIDTLSWLCRAIGNSGNGRYYSALNEVAESDAHRKLKKFAKKAAKAVGESGTQYKKGSVNIASLRKTGAKTTTPKAVAKPSGKAGLEVIVEGMSLQEVYDLVGQPTATTTHQTGKAWIPFNYGAKDLARTYLLYKGKGRVITSHDGYSSTSRVLEVLIDPNETGYP